MGEYTIELFKKENGDCPTENFINSFNSNVQAKILQIIKMAATNGPNLRMPHSRMLGDGIFELRIHAENNAYRLFYFFVVDQKIIITHGYYKKQQKTPSSEIKKAQSYRKEYYERYGNEKL